MTSTLPSRSVVAACRYRAVVMLAAGDHVLLAGSYSSALVVAANGPVPPPATRTFPFASNVAV